MDPASESMLMRRAALCVVLICLGSSLPTQGYYHGNGAVFHEQRLVTSLLDGYAREARPVLTPTQSVNVSLRFSFVRVEDLIESTDTFSATMMLVQMWADPRLRWNASDYGGLHEVRLPREKLWVPDIVLYNVALQGTPQTRYEDVITVTSDGYLIWVPMVTVHATCPMDLTRFPYDVQTCRLVFGSWTHTSEQMAVSFMTTKHKETDIEMVDEEDSSYYVDEHPQWRMVDNKAKAKLYTKKFPCCADTYTLVSISCSLARRPQFYRYVVVGPAAVMGLLVPALFLLPPASREKTIFGLLLLLCLTMMMVILETAIPFNHGSLPNIASFYLGTMILTCFSVLLSVLIINLSSRGARRKPLPAWIRTIFLGRMGLRRMLCLGNFSPVDNVYSSALRSDDALLNDATVEDDVGSNGVVSSSSSSAPAPATSPSSTERHLREILRCVRFMMGKIAADDSYRNVHQEWEELARVIDKCLFVAFFAFYVFTASSLLV